MIFGLPKIFTDFWVLASILAAIVASLASYIIADIHQGTFGWVGARYTGAAVVLQFAILTVAMLSLWYLIRKQPCERYFRKVFIVGVIIRILLIPVEPYTSNDVDRYLFDGRLLWEGHDPYQVNHEAEHLAALRAQWQPPAEHAAYVTLYPPLALSLFALASSPGHNWALLIWKAMVAFAGVISLWLMAKLLVSRQQKSYLPLFSLSPILLLEGGVGAHIDGISTLTVVGALYLWLNSRWWLCGVCIALGALCKFVPLVLLGPIFLVAPGLPPKIKLLTGFLFTLLSVYGLFFMAGLQPVGSVAVFFEKWRFGSPFFNGLEYALSPAVLKIIVPMLMVGIMAVVAAYILTASKQEKEPRALVGLQWTLAAPLLFSPVVFPWYLMVMVPLTTLAPSPMIMSWLAVMPLTYEVLGQFSCCGDWSPAVWPLWFIALAIVFGMVLDLFKRRICWVC